MNAYELAYKLNNALGVDYEMLEQSSIMLRQQADRIANLETALAFKKMKPLNKNQIYDLIINKVTDYELCRAIEERHGIK